MCIFSGPVKSVANTKLFGKDKGNGIHALVYQMQVELSSEVAMVLPTPVAKGSGDDAVNFIDLSGCPKFFEKIDELFPVEKSRGLSRSGGNDRSLGTTLQVHDVGDYEASYVPSINDFHRLDERFRINDKIWGQLPDYSDFGFVVFKLKYDSDNDGEVKEYHPMAFEYPANNKGELFFPTAHLHDGNDVPTVTGYDHAIYFQSGGEITKEPINWDKNSFNPSSRLSFAETHGLVHPTDSVFREEMQGEFNNGDLVVVENGSKSIMRPMRDKPVSATTDKFCQECGEVANKKFCCNCGSKQ